MFLRKSFYFLILRFLDMSSFSDRRQKVAKIATEVQLAAVFVKHVSLGLRYPWFKLLSISISKKAIQPLS